LAGERCAERALRARGWRFLARRLKTRWGELDLLFEDAGIRIVVEVKTGRVGPRFRPGMHLGRESLSRLWQAAGGLSRGRPHRVDLLEVCLVPSGRVTLVHHAGLRMPL
jgi:Holliday junction resolvase-like predicted endonuclease